MNKKTNIRKCIFFTIFIAFIILMFYTKKVQAAGKYDCVVIGDSGISGIYGAITGDSTIYGYGYKTKVNNVDGKNTFFLAEVGADYHLINNNYQIVKNALNNTKNNAKCLVWLGSNGLDYSEYPEIMNKLANSYQNINFYFISCTAINEGLYRADPSYAQYADYYTNNAIKDFNNKVLNGTNNFKGMKDKSRFNKNLFFLDIQYANLKIGNQTKPLYNWVTDNTKYVASDGLHYGSELNKAIWFQAMTNTSYNVTGGNGGNAGNSSHTNNGGSTNIRTSINTIQDQQDRREFEYKDVLDSSDFYSNVGNLTPSDVDRVESNIGSILNIVTNIGIVSSLIMIAILGIKYITGNKIDVKKEIIPYIIGAFLIFSICTILKILQLLGNSINV